MKALTPCTETELYQFVEAYQRAHARHLEGDVCGIYEPPLVTFNDFTLGPWPDSVVAAYSAGYPEGSPPPYSGGPSNWRIAKP